MPGAPFPLSSQILEQDAPPIQMQDRQKPPRRGFWIKLIFFLLLLFIVIQFIPFHNTQHFISVPSAYPEFVGRRWILQLLKKKLIQPSKNYVPIVTLFGEGGIGKTETAIFFANNNSQSFSLMYWINAGSEEVYQQSYYNFAQHLNIPIGQRMPFEKIREKVHEYLENKKFHKPWLLIYDNAEGFIEIPKKGYGSILVTTRDKTPWEFSQCIQIPPLSKRSATELFTKVMEGDSLEEWNKLAEELNFFPLALNQALHYVKESPNLTLADYNNLLEENKESIFQYSTPNARYPDNLFVLWQMNALALRSRHPKAFEWLQICAYLHPDKIPMRWLESWLMQQDELLSENAAKLQANEILRTLVNQGLIRMNKEAQAFYIHRLKQKLMQNDAENPCAAPGKALSFLVKMVNAFQFHDHLEWNEDVWEKLCDWEASASWWLETQKDFSEQPEDVACLLNILGNFNVVFKGKYKEGLVIYERAKKIQEKIYRDEFHFDMIPTYLNYCFCFFRLGKYDLAEDYCWKALDIAKKLYGETPSADYANCLSSIAMLLNVKDGTSALKYCLQAQKMQEQLYGSQWNVEICETRKWLGGIWQTLGDYERAAKYTLEALEINKKIFGDKTNIQRCCILNNLGQIYRAMGDIDQALKFHFEVLHMDQEIFSHEFFMPLVTLKDIAVDYRLQKKYRKSLSYSKKALKVANELYPDHLHISCLNLIANFGEIYLEQNKPQKALPYFEEISEKAKILIKGTYHDIFYVANRGLGRILCKMGKWEEGISHLEKALEVQRALYSDDHLNLRDVLADLGSAYLNRDPNKSAEYFFWLEKLNIFRNNYLREIHIQEKNV